MRRSYMGEPVLVKKNLTEKIMSKKNQVLIIAVFCVITLFLGTSYALLTNFDKTDNVITIKSGNLTMTVANDLITLNNKLPESDTDGLTNATPVIITLTNTGTIDIMKYDVKLVKEDSTTNVSTLEDQYIKYAISTDGGTTYTLTLAGGNSPSEPVIMEIGLSDIIEGHNSDSYYFDPETKSFKDSDKIIYIGGRLISLGPGESGIKNNATTSEVTTDGIIELYEGGSAVLQGKFLPDLLQQIYHTVYRCRTD